MVNVSMGVWENFSGKKKNSNLVLFCRGGFGKAADPSIGVRTSSPVHCKTMNGNVLVGGKGCYLAEVIEIAQLKFEADQVHSLEQVSFLVTKEWKTNQMWSTA